MPSNYRTYQPEQSYLLPPAPRLIGITEDSWATGLILALIWAVIGTGRFFLGRWRRSRAAHPPTAAR